MATMLPKLTFKESPFDSIVSQQLPSCQLREIPPSLEYAECHLRPSALSHIRQNKCCGPARYRINLTLVRLCEIAWVQLRQGKMLLPKEFLCALADALLIYTIQKGLVTQEQPVTCQAKDVQHLGNAKCSGACPCFIHQGKVK